MRQLPFLIFAILSFANCKREVPQLLAPLSEMEQSIPPDQLEKFKLTATDTLYTWFERFEPFARSAYAIPKYKVCADTFFKAMGFAEHLPSRIDFLLVALHQKLNYQPYDANRIRKLWFEIEQRSSAKMDKEFEKSDSIQKEITKRNYSKFDIKETFELVLPVNTNYENAKSAVSDHANLDHGNYAEYEDSLQLKVMLLKKSALYEKQGGIVDTNSQTFLLKIIKCNKPSYLIFDKIYRIGDTFELELDKYGREIE